MTRSNKSQPSRNAEHTRQAIIRLPAFNPNINVQPCLEEGILDRYILYISHFPCGRKSSLFGSHRVQNHASVKSYVHYIALQIFCLSSPTSKSGVYLDKQLFKLPAFQPQYLTSHVVHTVSKREMICPPYRALGFVQLSLMLFIDCWPIDLVSLEFRIHSFSHLAVIMKAKMNQTLLHPK